MGGWDKLKSHKTDDDDVIALAVATGTVPGVRRDDEGDDADGAADGAADGDTDGDDGEAETTSG